MKRTNFPMNTNVNIASPSTNYVYSQYLFGSYRFRFSCGTEGSGIRVASIIGLDTKHLFHAYIRFENTNKADIDLQTVYSYDTEEYLTDRIAVSDDRLYVDFIIPGQYASTLLYFITLSHLNIRRIPMDEPFPTS